MKVSGYFVSFACFCSSHHPKGIKQRLDLLINFGFCCHCLPDLFAKQLAEAAAESMDGDFHGSRGHAELRSRFAVRKRSWFAGQIDMQLFILIASVTAMFAGQSRANLFQHRQRPLTIEDRFGRLFMAGLQRVTTLSRIELQ